MLHKRLDRIHSTKNYYEISNMDWLLSNPQIHSTFSSLGNMQDDNYIPSSNALSILEDINYKLLCEDHTLRTYRRAIGFGQKIKLDLIPLLVHSKDSEIIDAIVRILVNLTVPVECLFSVDAMYRTEMGRHTIFEINNLLLTTKEAFSDAKCTKAVIDRIKSILETDTKLITQQCESINNCLLLLRNILHIPEHNGGISFQGHYSGSGNCLQVSMQNTIIWNLFIQSIDKILIHLLTCTQRSFWGVTMVQLIALMYKDQHVSTLQKLLSVWFEASLSESSEDNESNTSPPKQGSGDSSPMLTSDPTSDSSDNGSGKQEGTEDRRQANLNKETEQTLQQVSRKGHEYQNAILRNSVKQQSPVSSVKHLTHSSSNTINIIIDDQDDSSQQQSQTSLSPPPRKQNQSSAKFINKHGGNNYSNNANGADKNTITSQKRGSLSSQSEQSDCGYGTQVENQGSISTSSNDDDGPQQKPIHQKPPYNQKQRTKPRITLVTTQNKKDWRRKKLVKRSKSNLINMKGLVQHIPTDDDISNILKEFTVDFLLKGYGHLVQELHVQLLSDLNVQMDTSHFFWLVTYFLKFATQLELDLEHISPVLSFDIVSFLTYEGVMLCEQLELASKKELSDIKPYLRRMHLVVTAIREFLQALETYKKITHLSKEDRQQLRLLQLQITSTEDLRCLFILLLRTYNPTLHSKQYLQDLIVTNHILLLLLDNSSRLTENIGCSNINFKIVDHIEQFATMDIMHHYGLLLEDFQENGEFVNDCIFTMMHHVGGDLTQVSTLFQPIILKTYSRIWESEYEICDDWSDLIEYVIHKFMKTPQKGPLTLPSPSSLTEITKEHNMEHATCAWSQEEMDTLYWYYVQSKKCNDVVGKILILFNENGNKQKSRISIVQQLLQQDIITLVEYDDLMKFEDAEYQKHNHAKSTISDSTGESGIDIKDGNSTICKSSDDIQILKDRLLKDHKGIMLTWLQKVLIECCFVKLNITSGKLIAKDLITHNKIEIMEPIPHYSILKNKSIPIVPWNSDQVSIMLYQPFVLLLHKLGFHLPADNGKIYIRIPDFWTADILYNTAEKLGPIDQSFSKIDLGLLGRVTEKQKQQNQHKNLESYQQYHRHQHQKQRSKIGDEERINVEGFEIPKVKHSNSIIRFTPDPLPTPLVPNWLQLVMRSKYQPQRNSCMETIVIPKHNSSLLVPTTTTTVTKPTSKEVNCDSDGDSAMKSLTSITSIENIQSVPSTTNQHNHHVQSQQHNHHHNNYMQVKRIAKSLENEYSAMVASVYENDEFNCETESVVSDLTQMYVSDEEDANAQ